MSERSEQYPQAGFGLIDLIPCGVGELLLDDGLTILYANEFYYNLFGYSRTEALSVGFLSVRFAMSGPEFTHLRNEIKKHVAQGDLEFGLEFQKIRRDGSPFWALIRCRYLPEHPDNLICMLLDITHRKETEDRLRISEEQNRIALELTGDIVDIYDIRTRRLTQPQQAAELLGIPKIVDNVPDWTIEHGLISEENISEYLEFYHNMHRGVPSGRCMIHVYDAKRNLRWLSAKYSLVYGQDGKPSISILSYRDVTEAREKEVAYQKWINYFTQQLNSSYGYYEFNLTKDRFENIRGDLAKLVPLEIQKSYSQVSKFAEQNLIYPEDRDAYHTFFDRQSLISNYYMGLNQLELEHRRLKYNGYFWAKAVVQMLADPFSDSIRAFVMVKDIDEEKRRQLELDFLSRTDPLTGLSNRVSLIREINASLSEPTVRQCAFVMIDIDHFKAFNDHHGHRFGDEVLRDVANTLSGSLRADDTCGRLGGDEFVILFKNIRDEESLIKKLETMRRALSHQYDQGPSLTCTLGASFFPRDGASFDTLYAKADIALYQAKRQGRNQCCLYSECFRGLSKPECGMEGCP